MEKHKKNSGLVQLAMRRPISVLIGVVAIVLTAILAVLQMPRDILPTLGVPIIYVAQPYGGLDPAQMESYLTYYYEYHFLYTTGIEHIESKNIESTALIKLQFHPGTDMAQAMAETINYVNRAKAFMPPGTLPPFVMRFDAGSEPVGNLVFSSEKRSVGELQNMALNQVRPLFATLPGVSAPPPFGASQRTVVIRVDPAKLRRHNLSPYDVAEAIGDTNKIIPSGNIQLGNSYPIVPLNSVVRDIKELLNVPLRVGTYPTVFLKDVGDVEDGTDIQTGYALVNGRRTVYIPVTKRADASTLTVVDRVKENIPRFQKVLPEDVKVTYEFDQSGAVRRSIQDLLMEGLIGALLTGLMVLLFLRDFRSSFIVILNIPIALMGAAVSLWLTKQSINVMTLGGLALAIGILVDETTVTIENIHTHLGLGKTLARASIDATAEILKPCFLTMLCVLAVFLPSFFMSGVSRALFVPLTLAVGFSIIGSFLLSRTLVPILCTWLLKEKKFHSEASRLQDLYERVIENILRFRWPVVGSYLTIVAVLLLCLAPHLGSEIFPEVDRGQFQLRLRTLTGTSIEQTEASTLRVLTLIKREVGEENIESTLGFVGAQPPNYPINTIYLWTSGPHEAVLQVALKPNAKVEIEELKERLRSKFSVELPEVKVSFEVSSVMDRMLSQGSATPIEIAVSGKDLKSDREFAEKIKETLGPLPFLRDVQFQQPFDYPAVDITVDRRKAGLMGLTIDKIGRALVPVTSSSRYVLQNYWSDPKNGINYQVQVQVPQEKMTSLRDIAGIPISLNGGALPLSQFAEVSSSKIIGEYDRYNMQRMVTVTANLSGIDLGGAARGIEKALQPLVEKRPAGVDVYIRGQIKTMNEMFRGLWIGLCIAIVIIFLLLSANFESLSLSLVVLSTIPAVLSGVVTFLLLSHTNINIESFMGTIMGIGVAVANAILLVSFAERSRLSHGDSIRGAMEGAKSRLRPILMTSFAMCAGMIPMALGLGEGGGQTAPLGRAVIGGLVAATLATLIVLPAVYAIVQKKRSIYSASLDPDDPESADYKRAA